MTCNPINLKMPFWGESSKENFKAKLEQKLCLAKETHEATFDIADCNLSEVPSGVYSMCRVFRKESLFLQNNNLSNLQNGGSFKDLNQLLVLKLSNNKLSSLPDEIAHLSKLEILDLEQNNLKKLPSSLGKLTNLRHLNIKSNKFTDFPQIICSLYSLQSLDISDNPKLKALPKEVCLLLQLNELILNAQFFKYPSQDICQEGTESIMRFLCEEMGSDYSTIINRSAQQKSPTLDHYDSECRKKSFDACDLSDSYLLYQRKKDKKQQELALMEEALKKNYEVHLNDDAILRRKKLLGDITQEQEQIDSEILQLQNKKDEEKKVLLCELSNVENHSAKLIEQMVHLNDRRKHVEEMAVQMEKDRLENEEMFTIKQEELEQLRKREILEAMTEMLKQEEKQRKYIISNSNVVEQLQNEDNENNMKLSSIFQERELDQQSLINTLLEEEEFQKEAFKALQLKKDFQHQEIAHQIHLIEKELANLTVAELQRKDLRMTSDINVLAEHRMSLATLLSDLLMAKEKRENQLKDQLKEMELRYENEMDDFWLIQYQKLLNRKPKNVTEAELQLDPEIKQILEEVPALEYLPFFARNNIKYSQLLDFSIQDLKEIGILNEDICVAILKKTREYSALYYQGQELLEPEFPEIPHPSAPLEQEESFEFLPEAPTAPPIGQSEDDKLWHQTECVICMDHRTSAVFLPCGHVCCCQDCSTKVELCPMCRSSIASKFILAFQT